ncbi:MAG: PPOX class F420-dependent oxidoreductase [Chloroflexota bacterium]
MKFTPTELDYLAGQPLGRIATAQPDGTLQVSPVSFRHDGVTDTIVVYGFRMDASRKYKNVADNGRVAFVVDDLATVQPWRPRCLEIRGHAEALTEADGRPFIRIHPERIISFGIDQTDVPVHSLAVNARNVG